MPDSGGASVELKLEVPFAALDCDEAQDCSNCPACSIHAQFIVAQRRHWRERRAGDDPGNGRSGAPDRARHPAPDNRDQSAGALNAGPPPAPLECMVPNIIACCWDRDLDFLLSWRPFYSILSGIVPLAFEAWLPIEELRRPKTKEPRAGRK